MAKKSSIERNKRRERLNQKYAPMRKALKEKLADPNISEDDYFDAQRKLALLPRNSAPVRLRNRCILTGRSRAVYRKFGLSRIMLRNLALSGYLPGVTKASW
jgi:small subunit ribosomal protein S14